MRKIILFCLAVFMFACQKNECQKAPDVSKIKVDVKIERLEQELFGLKTKEEIAAFLDKNSLFAESFLQRSQYPHDSLVVNNIHSLITDPNISVLYKESQKEYADVSDLEDEFKQAFQHIKYYYPEFKIPKIQTMVTGFGNDLYVSDDLILIGLDYFIGPNATYRPKDMPEYILKRYRREYIVPSVMLLLSDHFNKTSFKDNSMLAEMVYYGKAYYFAKQVRPCTPDSLFIGYTGEQLTEAGNHDYIIWAHFIEKNLLYETSHFVKNKYLTERPKTLEIGDSSPGRIGVWLGWEIIKKYMDENPKVSLTELMGNNDAQKIFMQSKYKPKNR